MRAGAGALGVHQGCAAANIPVAALRSLAGHWHSVTVSLVRAGASALGVQQGERSGRRPGRDAALVCRPLAMMWHIKTVSLMRAPRLRSGQHSSRSAALACRPLSMNWHSVTVSLMRAGAGALGVHQGERGGRRPGRGAARCDHRSAGRLPNGALCHRGRSRAGHRPQGARSPPPGTRNMRCRAGAQPSDHIIRHCMFSTPQELLTVRCHIGMACPHSTSLKSELPLPSQSPCAYHTTWNYILELGACQQQMGRVHGMQERG